MGIERVGGYGICRARKRACKKSPQAWGLKAPSLSLWIRLPFSTCKKSPQAWGLKDEEAVKQAERMLELAKRVPKHGD